MTLYAMVDKSGHVCRDEDGKVVYDRPDHPSLDVRRFDMHRPQSKPHKVVPFASQPAEQPRGEPAHVKFVYVVAADAVSDGGHQLYTLHDEPVPMADNWRLVDPVSKSEQAVAQERKCEGGSPDCGPVELEDIEGVPLCRQCWDSLLAENGYPKSVRTDHVADARKMVEPDPVVGDGAPLRSDFQKGYDHAVQHMADIWMDPSVRELRLVAVDMRHYLTRIGETMSHAMREKWRETIEQADKRVSSALAGLREAIATPRPAVATPAEVTEKNAVAYRWRRHGRDPWKYEDNAAGCDPLVVREMLDRGWDAEWLTNAALASPSAGAVPEGWIVVKEHAWDHGDGGRPTLAYLWPSEFDRRVFGSFEQASAFIQENKFPLGWVALKLAAAAPEVPRG
ncbi:hypothetical protein [Luteibacter sp.]|uniref:hypothetical protein n=1 Tax=Luteibacter sp. TaxID=1886636 RepID=UPI0025BDB819|nr:hypothetical protein [Luteibacter sp.]